MTIWLIEPRDPLIFRDGRPFNASPGARAKTLSFPFPASVAGAVRTRAGLDASGHFDSNRINELLGKQVRGPLLVELDTSGEVLDWLFPAPADALLLKNDPYDKKQARIVPMTVNETPSGADTNLPSALALVGPVEHVNEKPHSKAPAFWRWVSFEQWLLAPAVQDMELVKLGHPGPAPESRMHVSIASDKQTAEDGALFQTSGLEFMKNMVEKGEAYPKLAKAKSLGLLLDTDVTLKAGLGFLGGEQRVARWRPSQDKLPECPPKVREAIIASKHCRLILATPALFAQGFLPDVIKLSRAGVVVSVLAVVNHRYQVVSGWDYAYVAPDKRRGRPKPTRRLAPAGSVYFLKLQGDDNAVGTFVDGVWLHAVSDGDQECRDGFGLALLGAWDGNPKPLIYQPEDAS